MNRRNFIKGGAALTALAFFYPEKIIGGSKIMAADNLKWWQKTIVYQIYPKSFQDTTGSGTGDLKGVTQHLDYLKNLGVGAIWLTPIYPSPMVDNGYDISDYTAINPDFGTMADFDNMVAEADKRGIKIVMDLVFNHSSDKHKWFLESKSSRTNAKADWYIWKDAKDGKTPTNWRSFFGGSVWEWCEERQQFYMHSFAKGQPDLNWENPEVRQALFDAANFWLDKGVGGFRIDAIPYIKKPAFVDGKPDGKDGMVHVHAMTVNTPGILDFLHEFKEKVFAGHDIFTVGEANGISPDELKYWIGDDGVFDMLFEFSHINLTMKNGEVFCRPTEWTLTELKKAISDSQAATKNNGWYPMYFENHDKPRCVNYFFPKNIDTDKAAKVIATILLTMRGTPFIYEGQELGMTNIDLDSIDKYNDVASYAQYDFAINEGYSAAEALEFVHFFSRDNARTPMQWNDEINAGFSTGKTWLPVNENYKKINAAAEDKISDSVLNWYRKLSKIRSDNEELTAGDYKLLLADSEEIFAFSRSFNGKTLVTAVNFSNKKISLPKDFTDKKILIDSESNADKNILQPLEARIYKW